jgi:DNA-binding NarL/FixJ family response regulator
MAADLVLGSRTELHRWAALTETLSARGLRLEEVGLDLAGVLELGSEVGASAIVLDGYPSPGGLRAISDARRRKALIGLLVIGPTTPRLDPLIAMASGVSGYVPEASMPAITADAIEAVVGGQPHVPSELSGPLLQQLIPGSRGVTVEGADGQPATLTGREWEVLVLLRQGRTTAEIAERLVVADVTVRSHVFALLRKLGATNRRGLTRSESGDKDRASARSHAMVLGRT